MRKRKCLSLESLHGVPIPAEHGHLALGRTPGQGMVIGGNISIVVTSVKGDVVRFNIAAPKDVPIVRTELIAAAVKAAS